MQEEKASVILSDSTRTRELAIFLFYRVLIRLRNLLPVSVFSCLIGARVGEILRMGHVLLYLSTYIYFSTMVEPHSKGHRPAGPFPVPPPYPWMHIYSGSSRRGRARHQLRQACRFLVNYIVCTLSHVRLGFACSAPDAGRVGAPLGRSHMDIVDTAWRRVRSLCRRLTKGGARGAGLERLLSETGDLSSELNAVNVIPYSRPRSHETEMGYVLEGGGAKRNQLASRPGPLIADRIDFPSELRDFRGEPFISARSAVCLNTPDAFSKPDGEEDPPLPIGKLADPDQLLLLAKRWDTVGRVALFRVCDIDERDIADCFPVFKEGHLR